MPSTRPFALDRATVGCRFRRQAAHTGNKLAGDGKRRPGADSEVVRRAPKARWPYGISANRATLEAYLRYHYEQGLSSRPWKVEEVFTPELLDT